MHEKPLDCRTAVDYVGVYSKRGVDNRRVGRMRALQMVAAARRYAYEKKIAYGLIEIYASNGETKESNDECVYTYTR